MKFDLTREAVLDEKNRKIYRFLQAILYLAAFFGALYLSYLILFPIRTFEFDFTNPNSSANSIISPRSETGSLIRNGKISKDKNIYFDTVLIGNFSEAIVSFTLSRNSAEPESGIAEIRRSYQAFFYPEGSPVGFRNGTLIKNNGNFYLISDGKLRKFENVNAVRILGFPLAAFITVDAEEMKYNSPSQKITSAGKYPDGALFKIDGAYYILEDQNLKRFASVSAYLTQYSSGQAISKDSDFLAQYPLHNDPAGFSDGSLISYGEGVYAISGKDFFPIDNPITFEAMGYDWNSVIPASADELALYQKGKLTNIKGVHPAGTVFSVVEDNCYYLIQDGLKHFLPSTNIANSWAKNNPIIVSKKGREIFKDCRVDKKILTARTYVCKLPIENLANLPGKDYEIMQNLNRDVEIDSLEVTFKKTVSFANLKATLRDMLNRIIIRYVPRTYIQ